MVTKTNIKLLTRDEFRENVFLRDSHLCVICKKPGVDAHHIMERRLFSNGGYFLDNGATLCGPCHIKAEQTTISCEEIRLKAKITNVVLPDHFYEEDIYDKWGNAYLPNGNRLLGELMEDESVKRIIVGEFSTRIKYPRTYHLPHSNPSSDDKVGDFENSFPGEVVVTEKMDGECTTLYKNHIHARSLDWVNRADRYWVRNFWAGIRLDIPENFRICGENLFAVHSIFYNELPSYFMAHSIWNGLKCLSWDEMKEYCSLLNVHHCRELYRGKFILKDIHSAWLDLTGGPTKSEGYVIRPVGEFSLRMFPRVVGKFVRENHIRNSGVEFTRNKLHP